MANTSEKAPTFNVTLEELNNDNVLLYSPVLVFCVLIMVIGIIGNTFVLIIYKYKFKRSSARNYILCLAMMDMSVCVVGIPYHVIDLTHIHTYTFVSVCKILSFLIGALTTGSIFVLLVVAIDRYLKVCRPLKKQVADFGDKRACAIAIAIAVVISIPNAILYGESSTDTGIEGLPGVGCFIDDYYHDSIFPIAFQGFNMLVCIAAIAFLVVIYSFICRKIYQHSQTGELVSSDTRSVKWCTCRSSSPELSDSEDEQMDEQMETTVELLPMENDDRAERVIKLNESIKADGQEADKDDVNTVDNSNSLVVNANADTVNTTMCDDNKAPEIDDVNEGLSADNPNTDSPEHKRPPVVAPVPAIKNKQTRRHKPSVHNTSSNALVRHRASGTSQKQDKTTRKITLMMMTITVVFVISYVPFIAVSLMDGVDDTYWDDMSDGWMIFNDVLLRLYLVNNMANAIIYSFWDNRFRNEVILLLRRLFCCKRKRHGQSYRSTTYTRSTVR